MYLLLLFFAKIKAEDKGARYMYYRKHDSGSIASELKKGIKWMEDHPETTIYRIYRQSGLIICLYWCDGYDPNDSDTIHAKDDPQWCLAAGVKVDNPNEWDGYYLDSPMDKNGDLLTDDVSISPNEDYNFLSDWLLKELEFCIEHQEE